MRVRVPPLDKKCINLSHLLRNVKGRLGNLLNSDYVIINGLLATFYGIDGVSGDLRKVKLPTDSPRRIVGHDRHPRHGQRRRQQQSGRARAWVLRHL